jgi:hypothetical protein
MCLRNVIVRAGWDQNRQKRITASNQSAVKSEPTHSRHPHVCDQAGCDALAIGVKINSLADEDAAAMNPGASSRAVVPARTDASWPVSAVESLICIATFRSAITGFLAGMKFDYLASLASQASKPRMYRMNRTGDCV